MVRTTDASYGNVFGKFVTNGIVVTSLLFFVSKYFS